MVPQKHAHPNPWNLWMLPYTAKQWWLQKWLIKDFEMKKLSWIIQMGPEYNHMCYYERKSEGDFTQKRKRQCDLKGRDQSSGATSQGMLEATRRQKRYSCLWREHRSDTLILAQWNWFWTSGFLKCETVNLSEAPQSLVIRYGSDRKLIHSPRPWSKI